MLYGKQTFRDESGALGDDVSWLDVWNAGLRNQREADNVMARDKLLEEAYDDRISLWKRHAGQDLENPMRRRVERMGNYGPARPGYDPEGDFDRAEERLAQQFPDIAEIVRKGGSPRELAYKRAQGAERGLSEAIQRSPLTVNLFGVPLNPAALGGALQGSFYDPFNAAANLVGPAGSAGRGIIWNALRQGAVAGASQAALEPAVQAWRKEAGLEHGVLDAFRNILFTTVAGGAIDAAGRTGGRLALGRPLAGTPEPAAAAAAPALPEAPDEALAAAARRLPEDSPIRRAADGDDAALAELARPLATEDPAVRGAVRELEVEAAQAHTAVRADIDEAEHLIRLAEALRNGEAPDLAPPAGDAIRQPAPRVPNLADDAPAPARMGESFKVEGKPVALAAVRARDITTDAATFQFKGGGDAAGATSRLQGVGAWDPIAAGRVVVYERADGSTIIADGHQRLSLAKRLEAGGHEPIELQAFVFREADGWQPGDVRALAAKKNLQEGTGSILDAAKILRERPDILDSSVPMSSQKMREARALARLSDEAFAMAVAGVVDPAWGAIVADAVRDPMRQAGILAELARLDPPNRTQARMLVADMVQMPAAIETQMTLLGELTSVRPLMAERAKILEAALKQLRKDERLFSTLAREADTIEAAGNRLAGDINAERALMAEATLAYLEALALRSGPVSDLLSEAAKSVSAGRPIARAAEDFARAVQALSDEGGLRALTETGPQARLTGDDFAEPLGEGAKRQLEQLRGFQDRQQAMGDLLLSIRETAAKKAEEAAAAAEKPPAPLLRSTEQLPGYGTPAYQAKRVFVADGKEIVGYEAAIKHLRTVAAKEAGGTLRNERRAVIILGPPASGKSTSRKAFAEHYGAATVSADDAKFIMPEMDELGAPGVHEESSLLAKMVTNELADEGANLVIEKLGDNPESMARMIANMRADGYAVEVVAVGGVGRDELVARAAKREAHSGRAVPVAVIDGALEGVPKTLARLRQDASVERIVEIDNSGERPQIIGGRETLDETLQKSLETVRQRPLDAGGRGEGDRGPLGRTRPEGRQGQEGREAGQGSRPVEIAAGRLPRPGEPFIVYRVGAGNDLAGHNAGNLDAVANHLARNDDAMSPAVAGDVGQRVTAYEVVLQEAPGRYEAFTGPRARSASGQVGLAVMGERVSLSFPPGGKWSARPLGEIPLDDVRARLAEAGYADFDEAGSRLGARVIREAFQSLPGVLPRFRDTAYAPEFVARESAIRADLAALAKRLLPSSVALQVEARLQIGAYELDGFFDRRDNLLAVSLAHENPVAVLRHEAIHATRNAGLFTDREWGLLVERAQKVAPKLTPEMEAFYRDQLMVYAVSEQMEKRGIDTRGLDWDDMQALLVKAKLLDPNAPEASLERAGLFSEARRQSLMEEELVARLAEGYMAGRRYGAAIDGVIQRILEFFEGVRNVLKGHGFDTADAVFRRMESGEIAMRTPREVTLPGGAKVMGIPLFAIRAFHGSPHLFDRFSLEHVGAGEGAQAYGYGLYFAENEKVARHYRDALAAQQSRYTAYWPKEILRDYLDRSAALTEKKFALQEAARRDRRGA